MKISTFSDYGLRTLIYLALNKDRLCTVNEISESYEVSRNHLVKVIHRLSTLELIESFKGAKGGVRLHRPISEIRLGELVKNLEEGSASLVECLSDKGSCKISEVCKLKGILSHSLRAFYKELDQFTLKDIVSNKKELNGVLGLS